MGGHGVGEVAGGGAREAVEAELDGGGDGGGDDAVLEGVGGVGAVVLDPEPAHAEGLREVLRVDEGGEARVEADAVGRVDADGEEGGVAPDVLRAGFDLLAGDPGERGLVVVDFEGAEALPAGVLGDQVIGGAAVATDESLGRAVGEQAALLRGLRAA